MDLLDIKPPLDVQVILWEKFNFVQSPRWLFLKEDVRHHEGRGMFEMFCPVCAEVSRQKLDLKSLSLENLSYRGLDYVRVVLKCLEIVNRPRGTPLALPDKQYWLYWAGQCSECKVIYWHAREYVRKPLQL